MKTGVIGLGAMGAAMALNIHKAGLLHRIWNRTPAKTKHLETVTGVTVADSAGALAAECELVLICVSQDQDVLEMINAIAKTVQPETIVADTSTVAADTAKQAAALLQNCDAYFLDCPVSGGVEGAQQGTLAMMVGGLESVLEKARPALKAITAKIAYLGPSGSGQACKAVNQLMAAGLNQAVTEALAFGQAMHLDMEKVVDVVATGAAGNWFLNHRGKTMLAQNFAPGFKLALHYKDLRICQAMLGGQTTLPTLDMTLADYNRLINQGYGEEDISTLFRLKQRQLTELSN